MLKTDLILAERQSVTAIEDLRLRLVRAVSISIQPLIVLPQQLWARECRLHLQYKSHHL